MFHLYHKVINPMIGKVSDIFLGNRNFWQVFHTHRQLLRESSIQSCSMASNGLKEIVETTAIRSSPRMKYGIRAGAQIELMYKWTFIILK